MYLVIDLIELELAYHAKVICINQYDILCFAYFLILGYIKLARLNH